MLPPKRAPPSPLGTTKFWAFSLDPRQVNISYDLLTKYRLFKNNVGLDNWYLLSGKPLPFPQQALLPNDCCVYYVTTFHL